MKRREFLVLASACMAVSARPRTRAQSALQPDLSALAGGKGLALFNRRVSAIADSTRKGLHLGESPGNGVAYIEGLEFANGTIELDVRGKDVMQQSFVGVAFHGVDGTTYEAVYLRPFNFKSEDAVRRSHGVQYVSHPEFTWEKLRAEQPGKYEHAVSPAPDPNDWFHLRITVAGPKVTVYVAGAAEPSLTVDRLSTRRTGLVGLWVGNNSAGDFANLKVVGA